MKKFNILIIGGGFISQLKALKVEQVAPCHCSGDRARELFKQEYGQKYLTNGVDRSIIVE